MHDTLIDTTHLAPSNTAKKDTMGTHLSGYQTFEHADPKLYRVTDEAPIRCELQIVSLDDNPYYEALSYVWGSRNITRSIYADEVSFDTTTDLFETCDSQQQTGTCGQTRLASIRATNKRGAIRSTS